jgi:ribosomal-protein-alanine N-acetyltransferase
MRVLGQVFSSGEKGERCTGPEASRGDANLPDKGPAGLVTILPMALADVSEVHAIETDSFPSPWPRRAFVRELKRGRAKFFAAFEGGKVVGYAGMRLGDPAHILNIAVHREYRRRKIGSRLLSFLLGVAETHGASCVTLEVRASNAVAQRMYRKFGFAAVGLRQGYYAQENEDAVVMAKRLGGSSEAAAQREFRLRDAPGAEPDDSRKEVL